MIYIDTFEPVELEKLLAQACPIQRQSLNAMGFADILCYAADGHRIQIENKQIDEVLSAIDDTEDQLRRQYDKAEESLLCIRGIAEPAVDGIQTYIPSNKGMIYHKSRKHRGMSYSGWRSWLYSLDKAGITVLEVPNLTAMAIAISSIYHNSQKAEHQTLRRYIKPKKNLTEEGDEPRDYVLTLMGIIGANLGEKRARALIRTFTTPFGVFCRSDEEIAAVEGMGPTLARRLLQGVGR